MRAEDQDLEKGQHQGLLDYMRLRGSGVRKSSRLGKALATIKSLDIEGPWVNRSQFSES